VLIVGAGNQSGHAVAGKGTRCPASRSHSLDRASGRQPRGRRRASPPARLLARRTVAEQQALAEIEAALDRLSNGQYGRCEQCREPIFAALLARQPRARYCRACACLALQRAPGGRPPAKAI
jgi:hypothetical protein